MIIVWDEPKRHANIAKHGIDFAAIGPEFFLLAQIVLAKDGRWASHWQTGWHGSGDLCNFRQRSDFDHLCPSGKPQGEDTMAMTAPDFTQLDLDAVSDNPELTNRDFACARAFIEVFPELAAKLEVERRTRGRPKADAPKVSTTLRLDSDILIHFRATGPGWQSRINAVLRREVGL